MISSLPKPRCVLDSFAMIFLPSNKTMREFLGQSKSIAVELAGIGCPVKHDEYVDAILDGLLQEYALVVFVIESKFETPPIIEVEALHLAHESHLEEIFPSFDKLLSPMKIQPL